MSGKRSYTNEPDLPAHSRDRYTEIQARKVKALSRFIRTILVLTGIVFGVIFLAYTLAVQQESNIVIAQS